MSSTITIDPVTRIEGHSKITIQLDDRGEVVDAHFHVTQFRGFERIVQGRPVHEMPSIMARICGICPVSHLIASSKAVDEIMAVEPPPTGADLRRIMNLAQIVQSNALSFFHLSSPDLLFGFDAEVAQRNIIGVARANPALARDGVGVRKFGQQIIEWLGGKRIHPSCVVPGGVDAPLAEDTRDRILATIPEALAAVERAVDWYKSALLGWSDEAESFGSFRSLFMGLVDDDGNVDHYDGKLRVMDADGGLLADRIDPRGYDDYLGEAVEPWSFLKSTYWKDIGYPDGIYRVGPLARMVVSDALGTPRADAELGAFRARYGRVPASSFHYHYARLIDTLYGIERIEQLLRGPDILSPRVRSFAGINRNEGIGVSEAPRGTLLHHYKVDDDGIVQWANLVIATGHNNLAMNQSVRQVAKRYVKSAQLTEPMLNRVEAVIRCYDPCLSCSTHALGEMALHLQLLGPDGAVLDQNPTMTHRTLVIGYGNVLRSDDGIGWHVAARVAADPRFDGVTVLQQHQLTPELALDVSRADLVALVDASAHGPAGTFTIARLDPVEVAATSTWTHQMDPATLVALAGELYGHAPEVYVVSVGVASLEVDDRLSPELAAALPGMVDALAELVIHGTASSTGSAGELAPEHSRA